MTSKNTQLHKIRNLAGFSLVEVLIALVIMSVGMLGIAGLYVEGMKAGRTSTFRHHAVTLAGDVADRIRANPRGGVDYQGVGGDNNCVLGNVDCNEAQMAANDIALWTTQAATMLPNGTVTITYDDTVTPNTYLIAVAWAEAGALSAPSYSIIIPTNPF
jgi:type IV pilus assembly protein PilV